MFKKIFLIHLCLMHIVFCSDYNYLEDGLYEDFPKGIYQEDKLRKSEDLSLVSMVTVKEDELFQYKSQNIMWRDEAPIKKKPKPLIENTRKIIREFYSLNFTSRWPYGVIPYELKPEIEKDDFLNLSIKLAIEHWEQQTCLKFEKFNPEIHSKTHEAKLQFVKVEQGCYSEIGYPDFLFNKFSSIVTKRIFLERNCLKGQVMHEIGHTIGFFHEHSRNDRDKYIDILWQNIAFPSLNSFNFDVAGEILEKDNLNIPYDVSSIMHYPSYAFAINLRKTIQVKDKNLEFLLGNRDGLSFYDAKMANVAYKCDSRCKDSFIECKNDGYMDHKCKCICPQGLTGKYCENYIAKTEKSVPLEKLNLTCYFTNSLCSWIQEKYRDEIDFIPNKGKTFTSMYLQTIGIENDRNFTNDTYLYLDSYYVKYPDESAQLKTPLISIKTETNFCLSFWYHMFGNPMVLTGELSVYLHEPNLSENLTKLWSRAGRQNHSQTEWLQAQINVKVNSDFRLMIKAQRFNNFLGDIGLDDIQFDLGECTESDIKPSVWTPWYIASGCFLQCGTEYFERKRFCQVGSRGDNCEGSETEFKLCPNPECYNITEFNSTMNSSDNFMKILANPIQVQTNFLESGKNLEIVNVDSSLKISNKCGDVINLDLNETVQLTSPGYPNKYELGLECSYLVKSENNSRIRVNVEYISLESTSLNACPDSVEIRYYALGQPGLRLCGNYSKMNTTKTIEYQSEANSVLFIFRSDWINRSNGFLIKVTSV